MVAGGENRRDLERKANARVITCDCLTAAKHTHQRQEEQELGQRGSYIAIPLRPSPSSPCPPAAPSRRALCEAHRIAAHEPIDNCAVHASTQIPSSTRLGLFCFVFASERTLNNRLPVGVHASLSTM